MFCICPISHYKNLPFDIPLNWVWVKHNDVISVIGGAQPPKSNFKSTPQEGYVRLYQIRDYGTSPVPVYIPIEMAQKTTKKGDVLLARYGASLGKVFFAEEGAYNVAMAKAELKYDNIGLTRELPYEYLNWNDDNTFNNVVFPEPDSPMIATYSPSSTEKLISFNACT